ncbi:MAG: bacteriocin [Bacteroidales bacterium]|nr:bacteriocin [Bacteroidales bacterium]
MGQEFVCILAHKAQKKQTENAVQGASALRDRERWYYFNNYKMQNLKLNELSKQEMSQITGGRDSGYRNINGHTAKVSYEPYIIIRKDGIYEAGYTVYCVCGCVYANRGGSSTDANHSANDAGSLRSY